MQLKRTYFLGIGGIGMSAIARYFLHLGIEVYGYDKTPSPLTDALQAEGMHIHFTEDISAIPSGIDLVVLTPAIPANHVELQYFQREGYTIKKRAEVLGDISKTRKTLAVAGTHGKTTTTAILTHLLRSGGVDVTAFLGGIAANIQSNFVAGDSDWVVVEADEYDRSFLHLHPTHAVITSLDPDHLDIYGDHEQMLESGFLSFANQLTQDGQLFVNEAFAPYFNTQKTLPFVRTYGVGKGEYRATNVSVKNGFFTFNFHSPELQLDDLEFTLPGNHNVENAVAAIALAIRAGVNETAIRNGLETFRGIQRRFECLVRNSHVYIDDYAHHPTELRAAIAAARSLYPTKTITGVFQPHLYSRTRDFAAGFAAALDGLDQCLLLPIYPARELPIAGVTNELILEKMTLPTAEVIQKKDLLPRIKELEIEVLMTLGAGDIDRFRQPIKQLFSE